MKKEVFISYSTLNKEMAYSIVKHLESNGVSCFIAPRDIEGGVSYASCLTNAIANCSAIVLVASEAMNKSEHIMNEIDIIVEKKKPIVPFFIEEFEMNSEFRYYLGRKQRIIAYPDQPSSYFAKLLDSVIPFLSEKPVLQEPSGGETSEAPSSANKTTVFEYIPERGVMINPEDHQRNVSFRTDTFINMFSGIFSSVADIAGPEKTMDIFHQAGYKSGQNFAQRLNSRWDFEQNSPSAFERKLKKWCEFDSNVGWGKFSINVEVNEETGDFKGELTINECFIVDKQSRCKVCEFVKGYCEGVIETLICVQVKLECVVCPLKNKFKSECVFKIALDESEQEY